jgi:phosphate transport system ATP-binding protein
MQTVFASSRFDPAVHPRLLPPVPVPPPPLADFIAVRDYSFFYRSRQALDAVTLDIPNHRVTALIGPSGCGKSTLLRSFNRMNDLLPGARHRGDILLGGQSVFDRRLKLMNLRRTVGLVFQKSNPLPLTIYENVACAVRIAGRLPKAVIDERVEWSLRRAALWDEVKDRLRQDAFTLSGGQLQRLCIARALACCPQVLLLDEPCSSLDPVAATRIEELITELSREFTIVLVTHNIGQAVRCADYAAFFYQGRLIESGRSEEIFVNPTQKTTADYLEGAIW